MVFYPAPVPMTLNLPQKLSKLSPASQRDKRRSNVLSNESSDARQPTAWLPEVLENLTEGDQNGHDSTWLKGNFEKRKTLPPQLRASIFFDHPALPQAIQVKENSAVATLDSILEASAYAPISAFTDHPIVGSIGAEIYSNSTAKPSSGNLIGDRMEQKKGRSSMNLPKNRRASSYIPTDIGRHSSLLTDIAIQDPDMLDEAEAAAARDDHTAPPHGSPGHDGPEDDGEFYYTHESFDDGEENGRHPEEPEYNGAPTTLLAELQLRKLQQKQRNRTAATAFPNGMHSTLLQLDAVAQVEKQTRRQKQITLAWEDPSTANAGAENDDDEDIPLGMLFPGRKIAANENAGRSQPVGLIQRRDAEDNEPLSQRRARLRGEGPVPQQGISPDKRGSTYTLAPGLSALDTKAEPSTSELETLAQRMKRLKGQADPPARPISGEFASELLGQFGALPHQGSTEPPKNPPRTPADPEEETLAQRRKRLQASQHAPPSSHASAGNAPPPPFARPTHFHPQSTTDLLLTQPTSFHPPLLNPSAALPRLPLHSGSSLAHNRFPAALAGMAVLTPQFAAPKTAPVALCGDDLPLDSRQRDVIDRWRQSVLH